MRRKADDFVDYSKHPSCTWELCLCCHGTVYLLLVLFLFVQRGLSSFSICLFPSFGHWFFNVLSSLSSFFSLFSLLFHRPVTFNQGASYITKREDETPVSIAELLGMKEEVRTLVQLNKTTYKGLNSKSKLLRGTILTLPARTRVTEMRVVSRATKRSQWLKWEKK